MSVLGHGRDELLAVHSYCSAELLLANIVVWL